MAVNIDEVLQSLYNKFKEDDYWRRRFVEILRLGDYATKEDINAILKEIKSLREDFNRLTVNVNNRFEENDRRFDQLISEMNKRFEEVNNRFEEVNKRFEENDKKFNQLIEEMHLGFAKFDNALSDFSAKFGKRAEAAARRIVREILKAEGIEEAKIENIILEDEEGEIFYPGFTTDVDLYYHNSESWLLEYKISCALQDVKHFFDVCRLAALEGITASRRIIVAIKLKSGAIETASRLGIEVWHAKTEKAVNYKPKGK